MDRQVTDAIQPEIQPIMFWTKEGKEAQHSPVGIASRQENIEGMKAELHKAKICIGTREKRWLSLWQHLGEVPQVKLAGGN